MYLNDGSKNTTDVTQVNLSTPYDPSSGTFAFTLNTEDIPDLTANRFTMDIAFDDDVIEFDNFSVLLDSMSYPYLFGSTLDFVEDLSGSKFVINNPNAKTTCGCGESFTI